MSALLSSQPAQVTARTYSLALLLSLGPALLPILTSARTSKHPLLPRLRRVLARDLAPDGFAFALSVAVGGGAGLRQLWRLLDRYVYTHSEDDQAGKLASKLKPFISINRLLSPVHKTFIANFFSALVGILLLQAGRRRSRRRAPTVDIPWTLPVGDTAPRGASPTLDLTLLLLVRALDSIVQGWVSTAGAAAADGEGVTLSAVEDEKGRKKRQRQLTAKIDSVVFWLCSARIMYSFFYYPERLPSSYVKWISSLANIDSRLLAAVRGIKDGTWSYRTGTSSPDVRALLTTGAADIGLPATWGDPHTIPAFGGSGATKIWRELGVQGRDGIGGLPCELIHRGVCGNSCTANASLRFAKVFTQAMAIYIPAHFIPALLTRPRSLLSASKPLILLLSAARSSTFLSTFVASFYLTVCTFHTFIPRLLPFLFSPGRISHDFIDGPWGVVFAGSFICGGASIWIEHPKRRGEMALYVIPRAIRAMLSDRWVKRDGVVFRAIERLIFALSLSTLLTSAIYRPNALRGLSKWTLAFITKGTEHGFWKRRRLGQSSSVDPTPINTPFLRPTTPAPLSRSASTSRADHPLPESDNSTQTLEL